MTLSKLHHYCVLQLTDYRHLAELRLNEGRSNKPRVKRKTSHHPIRACTGTSNTLAYTHSAKTATCLAYMSGACARPFAETISHIPSSQQQQHSCHHDHCEVCNQLHQWWDLCISGRIQNKSAHICHINSPPHPRVPASKPQSEELKDQQQDRLINRCLHPLPWQHVSTTYGR